MSLPPDERFARLSLLLADWQSVWRPEPFRHPTLPWVEALPGLAEALTTLDGDRLARLEADPYAASPLAEHLPVSELAALVALDRLPAQPGGWPADGGEHMSPRKWRQVAAFAARVTPGEPCLEWCAGKAHLARTLARRDRHAVAALEWRSELCEAGAALAERQRAAVRPVRQDVMAVGVVDHLVPDTRVAALHACGDLHVRLVELAAQRGLPITLSPCCYARTAANRHRPVSRHGRELAAQHGLALDREDLALAVQETVTAPRHDRLARERAKAWRLGFDRLQREVRGVDAYLPVPSLATGRLPADFAGFCRWAAERKGLALPARVDWDGLEAEGRRRLAEVTRLERVRHLFRRPLEIWLVLDLHRRLEEAGLSVALGTFCARELTPRNLMLQARLEPRSGGSVGR